MLDHSKQYYANLFKSRDAVIPDVNLHEIFRGDNIYKLTESEALSLEGLVTIEEIGNAVKKMKHNKTPGIDGFPAEFFKKFWGKLKVFVLRAIKYCYRQGTLSISMRQSVITCQSSQRK